MGRSKLGVCAHCTRLNVLSFTFFVLFVSSFHIMVFEWLRKRLSRTQSDCYGTNAECMTAMDFLFISLINHFNISC